ncbi:Protein of unknown function [Gryllus bimaculatus]|nr:Protein of unknown function [Gryllus bimaculatus]
MAKCSGREDKEFQKTMQSLVKREEVNSIEKRQYSPRAQRKKREASSPLEEDVRRGEKEKQKAVAQSTMSHTTSQNIKQWGWRETMEKLISTPTKDGQTQYSGRNKYRHNIVNVKPFPGQTNQARVKDVIPNYLSQSLYMKVYVNNSDNSKTLKNQEPLVNTIPIDSSLQSTLEARPGRNETLVPIFLFDSTPIIHLNFHPPDLLSTFTICPFVIKRWLETSRGILTNATQLDQSQAQDP